MKAYYFTAPPWLPELDYSLSDLLAEAGLEDQASDFALRLNRELKSGPVEYVVVEHAPGDLSSQEEEALRLAVEAVLGCTRGPIRDG